MLFFSNSQIRSLFHRQHCKRIALFLFCFLCNQIPDILHTVIQLRALSCAVVEFILQLFDMIFGNIFLVAHLVLQTRPEIHRDRTELYFHVDQFLCIL